MCLAELLCRVDVLEVKSCAHAFPSGSSCFTQTSESAPVTATTTPRCDILSVAFVCMYLVRVCRQTDSAQGQPDAQEQEASRGACSAYQPSCALWGDCSRERSVAVNF